MRGFVVTGRLVDAIVGFPDAPYLNGTFIPNGTLFTNVPASSAGSAWIA